MAEQQVFTQGQWYFVLLILLTLLWFDQQDPIVQCVMATNGTQSYVFFLYADQLIHWKPSKRRGQAKRLEENTTVGGVNIGDGIHYIGTQGSHLLTAASTQGLLHMIFGKKLVLLRINSPTHKNKLAYP